MNFKKYMDDAGSYFLEKQVFFTTKFRKIILHNSEHL